MDSLGLTSIFLACVDAGSFSGAGRRLNLSRSSVGKAVARLETQMSVRLFHRTTRSQSLTEDGQLYYDHARRAMSELEAARNALASGRREPSGTLRVSAPLTLGRHVIAPLIVRLAATYPQLKVSMSFADRPVDLIDEGYDLTVRIGPTTDSSSIAGRRIGRQSMKICGAPSYLARRGKPEAYGDLEAHELLLYGRAGAARGWGLPGGQQQVQILRSVGRVRFDDLDALADAAAAGFGLARLPSWLVKSRIEAGELVEVLPQDDRSTYDIMLLWPKGPQMALRVRRAIDLLAAEMPAALR
ncbi:LysR substrate-binding domain-containing protein [Chelatococcus asaccharovorans]|uniref:LysR family transcriptional regulator n=1 Tax=Chelatococcus asaccharovorans TaxID=28210 RepID=A0A2V3UH96_9HYPH|nr:LysR substrate-binding domain-containing protein [Chelatococcus asaccharovorans]MBS7701908.1 LysR family transcriptional regulator [Chelatococcus asaccharovorans]PXW64383.1 LysR family transcriptional regulator [Chelatococcus asaccharovorans]